MSTTAQTTIQTTTETIIQSTTKTKIQTTTLPNNESESRMYYVIVAYKGYCCIFVRPIKCITLIAFCYFVIT